MAGVKGLGATKVNSLLDAFNKPFMIGGLRRADGTARPATDLTATKSMSTTDRIAKEAGHDAPTTAEGGVGDRMQANVAEAADGAGGERIESPEWPSDVDEEEDEDRDVQERAVGRGREKVPSRSPPPAGNGAVWHDPLDDDEDDGDDGDGNNASASTDQQPPSKRIRSN